MKEKFLFERTLKKQFPPIETPLSYPAIKCGIQLEEGLLIAYVLLITNDRQLADKILDELEAKGKIEISL